MNHESVGVLQHNIYLSALFCISATRFLAHSKNKLIQWRGVRRLSVRPSVCLSVNFCANRFFSQANGPIDTKLAHDGQQISLHPECAQGQDQGQGHVIRELSWILGMSYSVIDGLVVYSRLIRVPTLWNCCCRNVSIPGLVAQHQPTASKH